MQGDSQKQRRFFSVCCWSSQCYWAVIQVAIQTDGIGQMFTQAYDSQYKIHDVALETSERSLHQLEREVSSLQTALRSAQISHAEALERCSLSRLEHQREVSNLVTQHANLVAESRREAIEQEAAHWRNTVNNLEMVRDIVKHSKINN